MYVYWTHNKERNGIEIYFEEKPDEDIRIDLRENGWRWSFLNKCWYHYYSEENEQYAEDVCRMYSDEEDEEDKNLMDEFYNSLQQGRKNISNDNQINIWNKVTFLTPALLTDQAPFFIIVESATAISSKKGTLRMIVVSDYPINIGMRVECNEKAVQSWFITENEASGVLECLFDLPCEPTDISVEILMKLPDGRIYKLFDEYLEAMCVHRDEEDEYEFGIIYEEVIESVLYFIDRKKSNDVGDVLNQWDNEEFESEELDASEWNEESLLRKEGYTVAQKEGLTADARHIILRNVLNSGIMTKNQIIDHLESQIALRKGRSMYDLAIKKWRDDITFLKRL